MFLAERAIRTIKEMMRLHNLRNSSLNNYLKVFEQTVETYNSSWINSETKKTPNDFVFANHPPLKPWAFRRTKDVLLNNTAKIDRKMEIAKKKYPINSYVRLKRKYFIKKYFQKKAQIAPWSLSKFKVIGYKRPTSIQEPVAFYLFDVKEQQKLSGIYYDHEIKLLTLK